MNNDNHKNQHHQSNRFQSGYQLGLAGKSSEFDTQLNNLQREYTSLLTERDKTAQKLDDSYKEMLEKMDILVSKLQNETERIHIQRIQFLKELKIEIGLMDGSGHFDNEYMASIRTRGNNILIQQEEAIADLIKDLQAKRNAMDPEKLIKGLKDELIEHFEPAVQHLSQDQKDFGDGYYRGLGIKEQLDQLDNRGNVSPPE
jgi:chromosome segregation ATPase